MNGEVEHHGDNNDANDNRNVGRTVMKKPRKWGLNDDNVNVVDTDDDSTKQQ